MSDCPHDSYSGDEGPVSELGRMPTRWRCDQCGLVNPYWTPDEPNPHGSAVIIESDRLT